ncbi:MAG: winged helix-turn-helix domain-containing protein, partial [Candidatus Hodarchaeota archaeon]
MEFDDNEITPVSDDEIVSITEYFKAIAHPKRLNILYFLAVQNSCDFARLKKLTKLSKTALANHISQLESLKLIERVDRGYYEITTDGKKLVNNTIRLYKDSQISNINATQLIGQQYMRFVSNIKMLSNVEFKRYRVSQLASLHGCLEYLGINMTCQWLFGVTGHAFIINIKDLVCPSG